MMKKFKVCASLIAALSLSFCGAAINSAAWAKEASLAVPLPVTPIMSALMFTVKITANGPKLRLDYLGKIAPFY